MLQHLLLLALVSAPCLQEPEAPAEVPTEVVQEPVGGAVEAAEQQPAPNSEEAVALLRAVAAAQAPGDADKRVDGFHLDLVLRDFAPDGTREVGLFVHYTRHPQETVELTLDDNGVQVRKGFDGSDYWLQEEGAAERMDLGGHEFKQDRDGIDEVLDMCADLMLLLDAEQLEARCTGLKLEPAGEDSKDRRIGGNLDAAAGAWEFSLFLPAEKLEPRAFWLYHRNPEPRPEGDAGLDWQPTVDVQRFDLKHWDEIHGRRAPRVIDVYDTLRKVDPETEEVILPIRTLELHDIFWDLSPKPAPAEEQD